MKLVNRTPGGGLDTEIVRRLALSDGHRWLRNQKSHLDNVDWTAVTGACLRHDVAPMAYYNLAALTSPVDVPAEDLRALKTAYNFARAANVNLFSDLGWILKAFAGRGIESMVLKGADLAAGVYPAPGLRRLSDLDLLIREDQLSAAKKCLAGLGYRLISGVYSVPDEENENRGCEWAFYNGRSFVELHWHIVDSFMPFTVDRSELWRNPRSVSVGAAVAAALSAENLILHLCLHQYKHGWPKLKWLADVAEAVRSFGPALDWRALLLAARRGRAERVLYHTLGLSSAIFEVGPPPDYMTALKRSARAGFCWRRWHKRSLSMIERPISGKLSQVMTVSGAARRFFVVRQLIKKQIILFPETRTD